ncbi:MAG TPA: tetratricopeptide repeat protein, partial [Gammaproteobacteria bacterium]|nr:tetratricopeptide repeat protein [Gammaproteobacteria bacterium]
MGFVEYCGHDDYSAALAQFKRAEQGLPNDANVIAALAAIHRRQGRWLLALTQFGRAATLDPRNPRRFYEIGVTLTELRRYAQAEQQFNRALAIEPQDYTVRSYQIRAWFLDGRTARARRELAAIPSDVNPQGSFSALRFGSAWLAHRADQTLAALTSAPAWVLDAFTQYQLPASLLRAQAFASRPAVSSRYGRRRANARCRPRCCRSPAS